MIGVATKDIEERQIHKHYEPMKFFVTSRVVSGTYPAL